MPPLQFRRGFTIHHGEWDTPVLMLHEIFSEQMYSRDLRSVPDSVIVDIGANIGAVALDFAEHWPLVEIHSYEPNPQTFQSLSRNVEYNHFGGRVKLFNEAVGACNGTFDIWTGVLSVGCSGYTSEIDPGAKLVRVPCVDLQTVFARIGDRKISLLKIDAEGAEVDILGSGLSFDSVEHVAVECHDNLTPHALDKCWSILVRHGFECKMKTVAPHAGVSMVLGYKRVAGDPTQNAGRPAATQSTEAEKIPS
jgi:FkbM family methyltransferase